MHNSLKPQKNLLYQNQIVQLTHFDIESIFNKSYHGCSLVVACSLTYPPLLSLFYSQCKTMLASMTISSTVLTGENMSKRGFFGPFRCCLCNDDAVESFDHIFINCVLLIRVETGSQWIV